MKTVAAGLLILATTISCRDTAPAHQALPFMLSVGSGGGITGARQDCRLDSSGIITRLLAVGAAPDSILGQHQAPAEALQALQAALGAPGAFDWSSDQHGNMTSWATWRVGETAQRWTWPGRGLPADAPAAFLNWINLARGLCQASP